MRKLSSFGLRSETIVVASFCGDEWARVSVEDTMDANYPKERPCQSLKPAAASKTEENIIHMSDSRYPVSATFKVLDGHDVYRSNNLIVALVVVESQYGRDLRLYRWMKRQEQWKVDLCRMSVKRWKWAELAAKALEFIEKYNLRSDSGGAASAEPEEG